MMAEKGLLFRFGRWTSPRKMSNTLEKKKFQMLEPFRIINYEKVLQNRSDTKYGKCRLICENEEYLFYDFSPREYSLGVYLGEIVLRRTKNAPNDVRYFGVSRELTCLYNDYLVQVDQHNWRGRDPLIKNIRTGEIISPTGWFNKSICAFGHFESYDRVNRFVKKDGKLYIDVARYIGDFGNEDKDYDGKPDYYIILSESNGKISIERQDVRAPRKGFGS